MKRTTFLHITAVISLLNASRVAAQFSSGSDGSYGPLNVTSNLTLDLPTNGVFHCTTITVANGATLRFNRNPLNTPVYLLATGDVNIAGTINVSGSNHSGSIPGKGGPGGFDGGFGAFQGFPAGDGQGPGGGRGSDHPYAIGGAFAFPSQSGYNTNVYGNTLLSPLIGGSGGGAYSGSGGAGGGGAILIASSTRVTIPSSGTIRADGGSAAVAAGGGSGGAIRVVAPIVDGSGNFYVNGGSGASFGFGYTGNGAAGRTRIDTQDRFAHRNIFLDGKGTRGSQMFVFPPGNPRLDIIHAAGTDIPEGTGAPVTINLPLGSSTNQIVRVQARNFTNDVPISVRITPENAASAVFDGVILQASGNPPSAEVTVTLPLDTVCYVHAWTR
jgi:hypothetical protein